MASTYSQIKRALDEIAERIVNNRNRLSQATTVIQNAVSDLTAMETVYGAIITDIENDAIANPENAAYQAAKAESDALVAEFLSLKADATDMSNALAAL